MIFSVERLDPRSPRLFLKIRALSIGWDVSSWTQTADLLLYISTRKLLGPLKLNMSQTKQLYYLLPQYSKDALLPIIPSAFTAGLCGTYHSRPWATAVNNAEMCLLSWARSPDCTAARGPSQAGSL